MLEFLSSSLSRAIILFTAMAGLISLGAYIVANWRGAINQDTVGPSELLTNFRELHAKGELSDEEFRTIRSKLGSELQQELRDSDKTG